jgi:outer membrane protein TolC
VASAQDAQEEESARTAPITLAEAVEMALAHNLDIALQRESVIAADARLVQTEGQFDPEWNAAYNYGEDTRALDAESATAAGGLDTVRSESQTARAGFGGQIPLSTRYSANLQSRSSADTFNDFEEEYVTTAGVTLTQPLLQGRGPRVTQTALRNSRRNVRLSRLEFRDQVESILLSVESSYWDLLRARQDVEMRRKSVVAAESLLEQVMVRVEVNTASEADRVQAESGLAQRRIALLEAERTLEVQDRVLKDLLLPDLSADIGQLEPVEAPEPDLGLPPYEEILEQAFLNRPELERAEIQIAAAEDQLYQARNQRLPQLDLEGAVGANGLGGSFSSSWNNGRDADNNNWSLGVVYRTPWPNRRNAGAVLEQESALRQQLLQAQKVRRRILLEVGEIYDRLKSSAQQIRAGEVAVSFARLSLENEQSRYDVQKSTVHELLLLETDLQQAELGLFQTINDHRKNHANLRRVCGTLLEHWDVAWADEEAPSPERSSAP